MGTMDLWLTKETNSILSLIRIFSNLHQILVDQLWHTTGDLLIEVPYLTGLTSIQSDFSFSGTVPYVASENAPSFKYGFSFIASDYYGFASAEGIFRLVVGGHQLSTSLNETIKLNGTLESEIEVDVPILSDVYLDGEAISTANISNVYAEDLPDYVTFNEDNFTLTGIFPDKCNIRITLPL